MNRTRGKLITVLSGKGGVGKTGITLNLAALLAKRGLRVLVVDADTGLANADVQLNFKPAHDLADALEGRMPLAHVAGATPLGFDLVAGCSGHAGLAALPLPILMQWMNELRDMSDIYDIILLDAAAGISPSTLAMAAQSDTSLLITTPDPSSLTDAYAVLKLLWQQFQSANAEVVVNQASAREAALVHERLNTAAEKFLQRPPLRLLGHVPQCRQYAQAVRLHAVAAVSAPHSPALQQLSLLAEALGSRLKTG